MNKQNQNGSIHFILISVVAVVIIGAVGYLFWHNVIVGSQKNSNKSEQSSNVEKKRPEDTKKSNVKSYDDPRFTFDYPSSGWKVEKISYDGVAEPTVYARTLDYAQMGMGLDAGAQVGIYVSLATSTLAEMKKSALDFADGTQARDMSDTTVSGVDAFSYNSLYEGPHYYTVFVYKGTAYQIVYQYAGTDAQKYIDGYTTLVGSLKLK